MKKLTKSIFLLLLLATAGITSCKKDDDHYSMDNQEFVTKAASSNMFEIAAGNLALQRSTNADVKAFGQHMVNDHGQATAEMATLAQQKGWSIPASMTQEHQNNFNMLNGMSGAAFDKQFAAMMVSSHQETIALFQRASSDEGVRDNDLRAMASGKLPTLVHHLEEAQQLQVKVGQ